MELGQKLKAARLEAGLSQRQLCGDTVTRNMLSQIENGSARPSLATLKILSSRLGKPLSFFTEDAPSENLAVLHRASQVPAGEALEILKEYLAPDPVLDAWYSQLSARCRMTLARQAIGENRIPYAQSLLREVPTAYGKTELILLQYRAHMAPAAELCRALPDNTEEMLLRAGAAWEQGNYDTCLCCLKAADNRPLRWHRLYGDALAALERYEEAIGCFLQLPQTKEIFARLEQCYKKIGNFEKAYEYACKQR